jgi:hypothetical protein
MATLAMTGTASAATEWFYERQPLPEGQTVEVPAHGPFTLYLKVPRQVRVEVACAVSGVEAFWNTPEAGMDKTRTIAFSSCTSPCGEVTVTPRLPWGDSILGLPSPYALVDEWRETRIALRCGGVDYGTFTGTLHPVSGDGDTQGGDETDSFVDFRNGQVLYNRSGVSLTLTGYYRFGYKVGTQVRGRITGEVR